MTDPMAQIEALKTQWMTGSATPGTGPWPHLDELSRLALTGQYLRIATRPASAAKVTIAPEIPTLPLNPMPVAARPLFRRALAAKLVPATVVVGFVAARGFAVNPLDWTPARNEAGLPDVYAPWRDWLDGNTGAIGDAPLTAETWDDFPPHSRYHLLETLHANRPEDARALILQVAPTLAADQRLRMLGCLRARFGPEDVAVLEPFATDRSSKVQSFVRTQLARVGRVGETAPEALAELPDFIETMRAGILSRKQVVSARKLKTQAQRKRRGDILAQLTLKSVADQLGLSPDQVVERWDFGDATEDMISLVAATGTDDHVRAFARRVASQKAQPGPLLDRLSHETRRDIGLGLLPFDGWILDQTQLWITQPDGTVPMAMLQEGSSLRDLAGQFRIETGPAEERMLERALSFLGLLADREAAIALMDIFTEAGALAVDNRLSLLRLNTAL